MAYSDIHLSLPINLSYDTEAIIMHTTCGIAILSLIFFIIQGRSRTTKSMYYEEQREKQALSEITDDVLFMQPESSHIGDCPICLIPLPVDGPDSTITACCGQIICDGCGYANQKQELKQRVHPKCPFCRCLVPTSQTEAKKMFLGMMKRARLDDPVAIGKVASHQYNDANYRGAFEYWTKAAELGSIQAHYQLSIMYQLGQYVRKDRGKEIHHLKHAAIAGHAQARFNLGFIDREQGSMERAVKHFTIAARQGDSKSLINLMFLHQFGVDIDNLAATTSAYHAAVDAATSPNRDIAAANKFAQAMNGLECWERAIVADLLRGI